MDQVVDAWLERRAPLFGFLFEADARAEAHTKSDVSAPSPLWIAVAPDTTAAAQHTERFVIPAELVSRITPLFRGPAVPYCVFSHAHAALSKLQPHGVMPLRFGCIRTAATLLAEGADGRRDSRPLERSILDELGTALPVMTSTVAAASVRVAMLIPLLQSYTPKLRERGLAGCFELECRLLPAVIHMERAGMAVDTAAFERVANTWLKQRESADSSPLKARFDKLLSTYRYWARDYADYEGRIHAHLHPLATDSGRFSCSQPNLQQVPSEHTAPGLRACFRPAAHRRLIIADYAQIELRVAAHLAPCEALREVFRRGVDPHRATAATLTGKPEQRVSPHERKLAKAINFGFLFGMGARRFSKYAQDSFGLALSLAEAERARAAFFDTFPGIAAWHRRLSAWSRRGADESLVVRTALGRRKRFPAGGFSFTTALNIPVQGTAAEGFKLAIIELEPALRSLGGQGTMCIHDEYIAEVPQDQAEVACRRVREIMERCMATVVPSVPIVVEAHVASCWR